MYVKWQVVEFLSQSAGDELIVGQCLAVGHATRLNSLKSVSNHLTKTFEFSNLAFKTSSDVHFI